MTIFKCNLKHPTVAGCKFEHGEFVTEDATQIQKLKDYIANTEIHQGVIVELVSEEEVPVPNIDAYADEVLAEAKNKRNKGK